MIALVPIAATRAWWYMGFVQLSTPLTFTVTVSPTFASLGMDASRRDMSNEGEPPAVELLVDAFPERAAYHARASANIGVSSARSRARSRVSKARSRTGASGV